MKITQAQAQRIITAQHGVAWQLEEIPHAKSLRCRVCAYKYTGITISKTEVLYQAGSWYDILCLAVPYFEAEYVRGNGITIGEYCRRLVDRRLARKGIKRIGD